MMGRVTFGKRGTVRCGSCRWYNCGGAGYPSDDCERITGYGSSHSSSRIAIRETRKASEINKNNDCPHWRWNWFGFRGY